MHKAFVYRLYPSKPQARLMEATLETCRRLYNQCLAERKQAWEQEQRMAMSWARFVMAKGTEPKGTPLPEIILCDFNIVLVDQPDCEVERGPRSS